MKKFFSLLSVSILIAGKIFGQAAIPNGDFENWTTSGNIEPVGWATSDATVTSIGISSPHGVVQDTNAANVYSGLSSVLLTTKALSIPTIGNVTYAGVLSLGSYGFSLTNLQATLGGTAYTDRPDSIVFAYKYNENVGANDSGVVKITLTKATNYAGSITVGTATVYLDYSYTYAVISAKINYVSAESPDTLKIQAQSSASLFQGGANGSQLWLDDMHFAGLDTIFKVYLNPGNPQSVCIGDSVSIRSDYFLGDSYAWYLNGSAIARDTFYKAKLGTAGNYVLEVVHNGALYSSDTLPLTVNPLPPVTYNYPVDTLCDTYNFAQLSGGSPAGGTYYINNVRATNGQFNPMTVGPGLQNLRYTYTDNNGCTNSAANNILLMACATGIQILQPGVQVSVFPNPASDILFIQSTNDRLVGGTVLIYDVNGKEVNNTPILSKESTVNLRGLSEGIYTISISDANHNAAATDKITIVKQ